MPTEDLIEEQPDSEWQPNRVEYQAFAKFAKMTEECRRLEERAKAMRKELEDLSYQLRDYLGSHGYQAVEAEGYRIFLQRDVWVRAQDGMSQEVVCGVLKRNGMGHFVREQYSTGSLTGHVRGLEDRHAEELNDGRLASVQELLPPEVCAVLNFDPKYNVIARRKPRKGI